MSTDKLTEILHNIFSYIMNFDATTDYSKWFIGIASSPDKSEIISKTKPNISHFKSWNLENKAAAIVLKDYLVEKGCREIKSKLTHRKTLFKDATYIYLYKNCE